MFRNYISQAPTKTNQDEIIDEEEPEILEEETKIKEIKDKDSPFFEVELPVDLEIFDGNVADIKVGQFVSFRYSGETWQFGPPKNPRISHLLSFFIGCVFLMVFTYMPLGLIYQAGISCCIVKRNLQVPLCV